MVKGIKNSTSLLSKDKIPKAPRTKDKVCPTVKNETNKMVFCQSFSNNGTQRQTKNKI
jgi:hypothetical protein